MVAGETVQVFEPVSGALDDRYRVEETTPPDALAATAGTCSSQGHSRDISENTPEQKVGPVAVFQNERKTVRPRVYHVRITII